MLFVIASTPKKSNTIPKDSKIGQHQKNLFLWSEYRSPTFRFVQSIFVRKSASFRAKHDQCRRSIIIPGETTLSLFVKLSYLWWNINIHIGTASIKMIEIKLILCVDMPGSQFCSSITCFNAIWKHAKYVFLPYSNVIYRGLPSPIGKFQLFSLEPFPYESRLIQLDSFLPLIWVPLDYFWLL